MKNKRQIAAVVQPAPEQLALDFGGPAAEGELFARPELPTQETEEGHGRFEKERKEALRKLEQRFGLILDRRVRVRIKGLDDEFTGRLVPAQVDRSASRRQGLRLRIGSATFDARDIEQCVLLPE